MPDPSQPADAWADWRIDHEVVVDAIAGTRRLREKARIYLRQNPNESHQDWSERVSRTVCYGTTRRASKVVLGMIDRHEPRLADGMPDWLDLSGPLAGVGKSVSIATTAISRQTIQDGMCVVWIGPEWRLIKAESILDMEADEEGNIVALRVGIDESTVWMAERRDQGMVQAQTWIKTETGWAVGMVEESESPTPLGLPVAVATLDTDRSKPVTPPLLDLAFETVRHCQMRSDRDAHLRIASCPIFVTMGNLDVDSLPVGPGKGLVLPEGVDVKVIELAGASLEASRQELLDSERRMVQMSIALLARHVKGAESAESRRIDEGQASSDLRTIARSVQRCLSEAVMITAAWQSNWDTAEAQLPEVPIGLATSQASLPPSDAALQLLADIVTAGILPDHVLVAALERAEIVPPGTADEVAAREGDLNALANDEPARGEE